MSLITSSLGYLTEIWSRKLSKRHRNTMKDINHAELESFQTCRDTITSSMGKYKHASGVNQPYEAVIP